MRIRNLITLAFLNLLLFVSCHTNEDPSFNNTQWDYVGFYVNDIPDLHISSLNANISFTDGKVSGYVNEKPYYLGAFDIDTNGNLKFLESITFTSIGYINKEEETYAKDLYQFAQKVIQQNDTLIITCDEINKKLLFKK